MYHPENIRQADHRSRYEHRNPPAARNWFGQPPGLTVLFLTETWERFSFYGMSALLIYYMTKQLHFTQADASLVFGLYSGGVFLTPILGGFIADRCWARRAPS